MILCDTNILIEIYKNNISIIENIKIIGQNNISISAVTSAELYFGAKNKQELHLIKKDINKLNVLPIDVSISNLSIELVEKYSLSHKLTLPDALIAATAIQYNLKLYTLNLKDFRYIDNLYLHIN